MKPISKAGVTLIEVMMAVALVALVTLGVSQVFQMIAKGRENAASVAAREAILSQIRLSVTPRSIAASKSDPVNVVLRQCLDKDGVACAANIEYPVRLSLPSGVGVGATTSVAAETMAGVDRVYYSATGRRCGERTPPPAPPPYTDCPIVAVATFIPRCIGGGATCDVAETIEFKYQIQIVATTPPTMLPGGGTMNAATGSVGRAVSDIAFAAAPIATTLAPLTPIVPPVAPPVPPPPLGY